MKLLLPVLLISLALSPQTYPSTTEGKVIDCQDCTYSKRPKDIENVQDENIVYLQKKVVKLLSESNYGGLIEFLNKEKIPPEIIGRIFLKNYHDLVELEASYPPVDLIGIINDNKDLVNLLNFLKVKTNKDDYKKLLIKITGTSFTDATDEDATYNQLRFLMKQLSKTEIQTSLCQTNKLMELAPLEIWIYDLDNFKALLQNIDPSNKVIKIPSEISCYKKYKEAM